MVKVKWGSGETEVRCSEKELAEAQALPNEIMFGCWLAEVEEVGHEAAMRWAWEYDEMLSGEPNPENPFR